MDLPAVLSLLFTPKFPKGEDALFSISRTFVATEPNKSKGFEFGIAEDVVEEIFANGLSVVWDLLPTKFGMPVADEFPNRFDVVVGFPNKVDVEVVGFPNNFGLVELEVFALVMLEVVDVVITAGFVVPVGFVFEFKFEFELPNKVLLDLLVDDNWENGDDKFEDLPKLPNTLPEVELCPNWPKGLFKDGFEFRFELLLLLLFLSFDEANIENPPLPKDDLPNVEFEVVFVLLIVLPLLLLLLVAAVVVAVLLLLAPILNPPTPNVDFPNAEFEEVFVVEVVEEPNGEDVLVEPNGEDPIVEPNGEDEFPKEVVALVVELKGLFVSEPNGLVCEVDENPDDPKELLLFWVVLLSLDLPNKIEDFESKGFDSDVAFELLLVALLKIEELVEPKGLTELFNFDFEEFDEVPNDNELISEVIFSSNFNSVLLSLLIIVLIFGNLTLSNKSDFDQIFQVINCPLFVKIEILGKGFDSSIPLQGSLTFTFEVKSKIIPNGVSSSPESSSIGIVALSESFNNSIVLSIKKKSISIDFELVEINKFLYFFDQLFKESV